MRRLALAACASLFAACQTAAPPPSQQVPAAASIGEPTRVAIAGRGQARAAFTAYALNLFDLQLSYLETLPEGWFIGTPDFEEGLRQIEQITGRPRSGNDAASFAADARAWRDWYVQNRPALESRETAALDLLFGRLEGTSPFLESPEFRDVVRSAGALSGAAPSWDSQERYHSWEQFNRDREAWRAWFGQNASRLEWDVSSHRLVAARGLPEG